MKKQNSVELVLLRSKATGSKSYQGFVEQLERLLQRLQACQSSINARTFLLSTLLFRRFLHFQLMFEAMHSRSMKIYTARTTCCTDFLEQLKSRGLFTQSLTLALEFR
jgi:hypothetical protein